MFWSSIDPSRPERRLDFCEAVEILQSTKYSACKSSVQLLGLAYKGIWTLYPFFCIIVILPCVRMHVSFSNYFVKYSSSVVGSKILAVKLHFWCIIAGRLVDCRHRWAVQMAPARFCVFMLAYIYKGNFQCSNEIISWEVIVIPNLES